MHIPNSIYFGFINFFLLVGLLVFALRRPVRDFFATRSAVWRKAIDETRISLAAVERAVQANTERLARTDAEIAVLRKQFQEEGELERATIVQRADDYAEKLRRDTERMIAQELKRTKEHLRGTTVDLAILMAERYLREQVTSDDQMRLIRRYVERLGQLQ